VVAPGERYRGVVWTEPAGIPIVVIDVEVV
jgi:hypothetical protein